EIRAFRSTSCGGFKETFRCLGTTMEMGRQTLRSGARRLECGTSSLAEIRAFRSTSNGESLVMCLSRCAVVWQDHSSSGKTDHDEPQVGEAVVHCASARDLCSSLPSAPDRTRPESTSQYS